MQTSEDRVAASIHEYVFHRVALGIYDPQKTLRPKVPVIAFEIEFLEIDEDNVAVAAGSVTLRSENGGVEKFLRITVAVGDDGTIPEGTECRAAYIEVVDDETGACKETAALANV